MKKAGFVVAGILSLGVLVGVLSTCGEGRGKRSNAEMVVSEVAEDSPARSVNLHVYLENSGSMNGYVKGNTGFEQSIYYYLSQVEGCGLVDSIGLYYINSKVIPQGSDVEAFIHHVEPADFKRKGGDLGSSDIAVLLDTVLTRHCSDDVSMFISDCIFSPGKKKMRAEEVRNYLIEQSTRIERIFRDKLKGESEGLAVVIWQLQSDFVGYYYNREDEKTWIEHKRPFYFWLIGAPGQVRRLLDAVPSGSLAGKGAEVENVYVACSGGKSVGYGVVNAGKIGSFERSRREPKSSIVKCRPDGKGRQSEMFRFAVGVDYAGLPLGDGFLSNPDNYEVSTRDFEISVEPNRYGENHYTHLVCVTTTQVPVPATQLEIALKNRMPDWVEERNDAVGVDLERDDAFDKTFGLKALLDGVHAAFGGDSAEYVKIRVSINKN